MHTTVVFTGGPLPDPDVVHWAGRALENLGTPPDVAVAADGGLHLARELGVRVDLVVGDLDSADPVLVEAAAREGASVDRSPRDKDLTDLELALEAAVDAVASEQESRIVVVGHPGGRMDHLLAGIAVLGSPRWAGVELSAHLGATRVLPVWSTRTIPGTPGRTVSLLAAGGPAEGVTTSGLKWTLSDDVLEPGSGRGVSNEFAEPEATVSVRTGCVVVLVPGSEEVAR